MADEWFHSSTELFNNKSFDDNHNQDIECCVTDKENKDKLMRQNYQAQNSSPQHNIIELGNQMLSLDWLRSLYEPK